MTSRFTVTTSWDDGHILDLKLAELLERYQLKGTFYVAPENHEFAPADRLSAAQIAELSGRFEIGAHTLTHPRLPQVDDATAAREITGSKAVLTGIIGRPVTTFCYPGGEYQPQHVRMVETAGFTYARTVERFATTAGRDRLTAPTTLHTYRHWSDAVQILRFAKFRPGRFAHYLLSWDQLAIAQFDHVAASGGVFHLWGHSWEIDKNHDWERLERVFAHITGHPQANYLTNGELA